MLSCSGTLCLELPPTRWITRSYKKSPPRARVKPNSPNRPDILLQVFFFAASQHSRLRPQFGAAMRVCLRYLTVLAVVVLPVRMPTHASPQNKPTESQSAPASKHGPSDGVAELPRTYVESSLRATPAPGKTLTVRAGDDASQALSKAA